ncbi:hypothetical protein C8J56DRAFT_896375 [Mycena floridula]|nr:hypothetical protein C8J56DRAFT_896375 [Mycena floridula]
MFHIHSSISSFPLVPGTPTETNRFSSADESSIMEETVVKENGDAITESPGRKPNLKVDLSAANPVFSKANVSKGAETDSVSPDSDSFTSIQASLLSNSNSLHRDNSYEAGRAASHDSNDQPSSQDSSLHSDSEEEITTPRLDTGKARAPTPSIEHEKVSVRFRGNHWESSGASWRLLFVLRKLALSSTGASFTDTSESERQYDSAEDYKYHNTQKYAKSAKSAKALMDMSVLQKSVHLTFLLQVEKAEKSSKKHKKREKRWRHTSAKNFPLKTTAIILGIPLHQLASTSGSLKERDKSRQRAYSRL